MKKIKRFNIDDEIYDFFVPIGGSIEYAGVDLPYGFLYENGAHVSKNLYPVLYSRLTKDKGFITSELSTTTLFTLTAHGLETGDKVAFLSTTGELPTGVSLFTNYYVIWVSANTFGLASTYANAIAATPVPIGTTAGGGTHQLLYCPWGIYDAFDFYLPDTRGIATFGVGQQGVAPWASSVYTERLGHYLQDQMQKITGSLGGITTDTDGGIFNTRSGAFTFSGTAYTSSPEGGTFGGNNYKTMNFDSANSPNARTSSNTAGKTAPARVGKYKIIRAY